MTTQTRKNDVTHHRVVCSECQQVVPGYFQMGTLEFPAAFYPFEHKGWDGTTCPGGQHMATMPVTPDTRN